MPAFDGGDTHFTIYPLKETQILLLLAAKKMLYTTTVKTCNCMHNYERLEGYTLDTT
jgi:hypothetical protein